MEGNSSEKGHLPINLEGNSSVYFREYYTRAPNYCGPPVCRFSVAPMFGMTARRRQIYLQ